MTDPMTPVRALLELATNLREQLNDGDGAYPEEYHDVANAAGDATASISQLLSEHDKVVEYIKELRTFGSDFSVMELTSPGVEARMGFAASCADRLQSIVEGK